MVWGLLVTALARPQWIADPLIRILPARDMLIAVDLSGSMENRDFTDATGHQVDRVTAVKEVMDDFLSRRDGDRVGLMFFGTAPFIQVPFTDDLNVSRVLLKEAQARMAGPQTLLGDAVGKAITVFENSDVKEKVLIVLADGNDSGSLVSPVKAAEIARDQGIRIHTIGMGDPATLGEDRLDVETLTTMAEITGGQMFLAINREELEAVYARIDAITTRQVETLTHRPVTDLYFLPLAAALLMVLLFHSTRLWLTRPAVASDADQPQASAIEDLPQDGVR
jgi:Ca-activated chloride channel family protein